MHRKDIIAFMRLKKRTIINSKYYSDTPLGKTYFQGYVQALDDISDKFGLDVDGNL